MLVFIFLIAFTLALAALAAGLWLLEAGKGALGKTAAFILAIGGALALACAGYHGLKYYFTGGFDGAYSGTTCAMSDKGMMGGAGMMGKDGMMPMMGGKDMMDKGPSDMGQKGMMDKKDMKMGDMGSSGTAADDSSAATNHENHHH